MRFLINKLANGRWLLWLHSFNFHRHSAWKVFAWSALTLVADERRLLCLCWGLSSCARVDNCSTLEAHVEVLEHGLLVRIGGGTHALVVHLFMSLTFVFVNSCRGAFMRRSVIMAASVVNEHVLLS